MIRGYRIVRLALPLALVLGLFVAAPALADSVATKQAQGAQILSQVQHGTLNPKALTATQYEDLGEYLMSRAVGSTQLHQRMNGQGTGSRMGPSMMGYGYAPTASASGGWPIGVVVAIVALGAALIAGLGWLALPRVRKR